MFNQEPIQHTTLLNNEMKNPHLVETTIIAYPATGRVIERDVIVRDVFTMRVEDQIPRINVDFMIQGIPILLTTQSYLTLRFNVSWERAAPAPSTPVAMSLTTTSSGLAPSSGGEVKPSSADEESKPSASGGGVSSFSLRPQKRRNPLARDGPEDDVPAAGGDISQITDGGGAFIIPPFSLELDSVIGTLPSRLELDTSLWPKLNSQVIDTARATFSNFGVESRNSFFINYLRSLQTPPEVRDNDLSTHNDVTITNFPFVSQRKARTTGIFSHVENAIYGISMSHSDDDKLYYPDPISQAFEIRIPLAEILPVFQIPVLPIAQTNTSNIALNLTMFSPATMFPIYASFRSSDGKMTTVNDALVLAANTGFKAVDSFSSYNPLLNIDKKTFVGVDKLLYQMIGESNVLSIEDFNEFLTPTVTTECWLNLKVLTDPMLNPLVEAYIRPFITPANEFRAMFSDVFTYSQTLIIPPHSRATFNFAPSQLFYNTTQVGVFFVQDMATFTPSQTPETLNFPKYFSNTSSAFKSGHFCKKSTLKVTQFQIGLSSSCTPLFSEPLDESGMQLATEDCFRKYRPTNMVGNIIQDRGRMAGGDAFYLFDLTHTEGAGYFIDADNMITVSGTLNNFASEDAVIQVILCLFYQNSFTVILELDGAVLIQQS